jgi:hypothetical protein
MNRSWKGKEQWKEYYVKCDRIWKTLVVREKVTCCDCYRIAFTCLEVDGVQVMGKGVGRDNSKRGRT